MDKFTQVIGNIHNLLLEMPIASMAVMDSIKDDGFDTSTVKLLNNPRIEDMYRKGWSKSTGNFDLKFLGGDASKYVEYGIASQYDIVNKLGIKDFKPDHNNITIFFTNNKGADLRPITPWIAAHRFGHALRASRVRSPKIQTTINDMEDVLVSLTNTLLSAYGYDLSKYSINNINQYITAGDNSRLPKDVLINLINNVGTMRSARTNSIDRQFELFYELIAQQMTTGKVTFDTDLKPIEYKGKILKPKNMGEYEKRQLELLGGKFTNLTKRLINQSKGDTFIM
jgi:hypothetical protein